MKIKVKQMPPLTGFTNGKLYDVLDRFYNGYEVLNDNDEESKIHEFNTEVINVHPHADLIMEYAKIAQYDDKPWKHFQLKYDSEWVVAENPLEFNEYIEYRLKPRIININGFEVPEPVRSIPAYGIPYFIINSPHVEDITWNNSDVCKKLFKNGLIHLTREAAEKHLEALLSFTKE